MFKLQGIVILLVYILNEKPQQLHTSFKPNKTNIILKFILAMQNFLFVKYFVLKDDNYWVAKLREYVFCPITLLLRYLGLCLMVGI